MNDRVRIKLQPRGLEALRDHFQRLGLDYDRYAPKPDRYGRMELALWEVMHYFGGACYMGPEPPFETEFEVVTGKVAATSS